MHFVTFVHLAAACQQFAEVTFASETLKLDCKMAWLPCCMENCKWFHLKYKKTGKASHFVAIGKHKVIVEQKHFQTKGFHLHAVCRLLHFGCNLQWCSKFSFATSLQIEVCLEIESIDESFLSFEKKVKWTKLVVQFCTVGGVIFDLNCCLWNSSQIALKKLQIPMFCHLKSFVSSNLIFNQFALVVSIAQHCTFFDKVCCCFAKC